MTFEDSLQQVKTDNRVERQEQELTAEEKKGLIGAWLDVAVESDIPNEIDEMSNDEIRNWLAETLMSDASLLAKEWEITPDDTLIEGIHNETIPSQQSVAIMAYIESVRMQFKGFREKNNDTGKSTKWDGWPKAMRTSRAFNCAGAALIGQSILEKAGIPYYSVHPFSHMANVIKLPDGDWVYIDFNNDLVKKIDPKEITIAGIPTLEISNDKDIEYRYLPLFTRNDVPAFTIGNFYALGEAAKEEDEDELDQKETQKMFSRYREVFSKNDFSHLEETLYPSVDALLRSQEMEEERARIEKRRSLPALVKRTVDYVNELRIPRKKLIGEIREHTQGVRDFLYTDDDAVLSAVSAELGKALKMMKADLTDTKEKDRDTFHEFVEWLVSL